MSKITTHTLPNNIADQLETHTGVLILKLDVNGLIIYGNKKSGEVLGYPLHDLKGKDFYLDLIPESSFIENGRTIRKNHLSGNVTEIHFETLIVNKDRSQKIIYWNAIPLRDNRKNVSGQLLTGTDITQLRKQWLTNEGNNPNQNSTNTHDRLSNSDLHRQIKDHQEHEESALEEQNEKYKQLFDHVNEAIFILDSKSRFIECNLTAQKLFMFSKEDLIGKTPDMVSPEYQNGDKKSEDLARMYVKRTLTGQPQRFRWIHQKSNGAKFPAEISLQAYTSKGNIYVYGFVWDLSIQEKTEQALKESEERFKILSDLSFEGILLLKDGIVKDLNSSLTRLFGYSYEEALKIDFMKTIIPEKYHREINRLRPKDYIKPFELEGIKKDGTLIPLEIEAKNIVSKGEQIRVIAIREINERKKAEQNLKESEERFKMLSDISFEGILIHNDGIILDMNISIEKMSGYKREELIGKNIVDMIVPEKYKKLISKFREEKKIGPFEIMGRNKAGVLVPFEVEVKPIIYKNKNVRMVAVRDISKRKKTEQKLKESEERFKLFSDISFEGILIHERGIVLDTNTSFLTMSGYDRKDLIGQNILDVAVPKKYHEIIRNSKGGDKTGPQEVMGQKKDGKLIPVEIEAKDIKYKNKNVRMVAVRDISDRKKAELKLKKQDKIIKQTNKELSTFLYRSSHDLRGPLTTLLGLTTLAEIENIDEQIQHYFGGIKDTVFQMMRILRKLNDIYFLFNEKHALSMLDCDALLKTIKFDLEKVDHKQEITKTFNNEIKLPIRSNEMLLSMIILYVMENSIVHKRDDVESYVRLSLTEEENHLIIVVEDNGIGIPAKIKPKIFNMFFRGSEQSKGNGLGLYLVKKAVDILSGTCHVSSKVDKFTKMVVRIPIA